MNRKLRRKAARNDVASFERLIKKADTQQNEQIRKIEKETRQAAQNHVMGLMYCIFILVLRRMLKLGPLRTLRILNEVAAIINDIDSGVVTVFDLKREAEEAGIQVVFSEKYDIIECGIFEEDAYANVKKKIDEERMKLYNEHSLKGTRLWTDPEFAKKGGA